MTPQEDEAAKRLFDEFWAKYPYIKNPSGINLAEKAEFLIMKGFESIRLMQRARKQARPYTRFEEDDIDDDDGE